jgi:hypothetical protein
MPKLPGLTRIGLVAALSSGLLGAVVTGGTAYAAPGSSSNIVVKPMADSHNISGIAVVAQPNGDKVATLTDPFVVGDCELARGTTVTLRNPSDNGDSSVVVRGQVKSSHPQTAWYDQWHSNFTFRSGRGTQLVTAGSLDGPEMRTGGAWYGVDAGAYVKIAPDLFDLVTKVDWSGEC